MFFVIRPDLHFQFIPKALEGVEVRALCRPVRFFHTKLGKHFYMELACTQGHCHVERGKGQTLLSKISLFDVALRFPSLESRGPNQDEQTKTKSKLFHQNESLVAKCIGVSIQN